MMKKFIWIPIFCLLFLCGCAGQTAPETTGTMQPATEITAPTVVTEAEKYPDVLDCASIEGMAIPDSNMPCRINLRKYRNFQSEHICYDLYIEVDTGTQVITKELEVQVSTLPVVNVFLGDVDGDGIQEILVHDNTGGVGGAGLWRTWVLKVENDDIRILFKNFNEFNTGFESRFLDGYQMEVKNNLTGYTLVFDVKNRYGEYIDGSSQLPAGNIWIDPFYVFEPQDKDEDGISEILCKQYTSYICHADYTGTACSVLKFNTQTQMFEVIDAWYEPNTEA